MHLRTAQIGDLRLIATTLAPAVIGTPSASHAARKPSRCSRSKECRMTRMIAATLALLAIASPSIADTIPIVGTTKSITLYQGDTITSPKPMIQSHANADGSVQSANGCYVDRQHGQTFCTNGITGFTLVPGSKYSYAPVNAPARAVVAPAVSVDAAPITPGVNLAGCNVGSGGALCPAAGDVDAYDAAGFRIFRFGFNDTVPVAKLALPVDEALAKGATAILDRHDYTEHTAAQNLAYWLPLLKAGGWIGNPKVMVDLDNEPRTIVPNDFMQSARDVTDTEALFLANGITNPILYEWPGSSAIFRFDKGEKPAAPCISAGCAIDRTPDFPKTGNIILSPHGYLDHGGSGTSPNCDPYYWTYDFAAQARKRGLRAIIGEQAWGSYLAVRSTCATPAAATLAGIRANPDVYIGFTQWGGGREWPASYIFTMAPKGHTLDNAYVHSLTGK